MTFSILDVLKQTSQKVFKGNRQNEQSNIKTRKISQRQCKRAVSTLNSCATAELDRATRYVDVYKDLDSDEVLVYINDDTLAQSLYKGIKSPTINFPQQFENLVFVEEKGSEKIDFVIFEEDFYYGGDEPSYIDLNKSLNCIDKWFDWFFKTFSGLYIDYKVFFEELANRSIVTSFFLAISLDEPAFSYENLVDTANVLLGYFYRQISYYTGEPSFITSVSTLKDQIQNNDDCFYARLRRGIYTKRINGVVLEMPEYFFVNVIQLALDENCFKSFSEFFSKIKYETFVYLSEKLIVIDEQRFKSFLKYQDENHRFILYGLSDGTDISDEYFLEIKDKKDVHNIRLKLGELSSSNLIENTEFLYLPETDTYYINHCRGIKDSKTIKDFIHQKIEFEQGILDIIQKLQNTFSWMVGFFAHMVFLDCKKNMIESVYTDESLSKLEFEDIFSMDFSEKDGYYEFDSSLLIIQCIELYIRLNNVDVSNIYKCEFMKILPPAFAECLIEYINTQTYPIAGCDLKTISIMDNSYLEKIEFLENIPTNDKELCQRITFFKSTNPNEIINSIIARRNDAFFSDSPKINGASYVYLDEQVDNDFFGKNVLRLSGNTVDKIIINDPMFLDMLCPQKVIISKDIMDNGQYTIIGIVWNQAKLYNMYNLIQNKIIGVPQIYQIIGGLLDLYSGHGHSLQRLDNAFDTLLVNDNLDPVINSTYFRNKGNSRVSIVKKYYNTIMELFCEKLADIGFGDFPYFKYDELFDGKDIQTVLSYAYAARDIKLCPQHNQWYIKGNLCLECQNIYLVDNEVYETELYEDEVSKFYAAEEYVLGVLKEGEYEKRVRLGIENGIYRPFLDMAPRKIVVKDISEDMNKEALGIVYSNYDFSNVLLLQSFNSTQKLKIVLLLYKKVLPHILEGKFICFDEHIFTTMVMDKRLKGQIIVPNIALLETEIILSSDETLRAQAIDKTLKVFSKFLTSYIMSDDILRSELESEELSLKKILNSIKICDFKESYIREYFEEKNKYCRIHGVNFSKHSELCPVCIRNGISSEAAIFVDNKYLIDVKSKSSTYEGGEAKIYPYGNNQVQKLFNDDVDLDFKSKIIGKVLKKAKLFQEFNKRHQNVKFVIVDKVLFSRENNTFKLEGYTEDYIDGAFKISSLKDKAFAESLGYSRKDIVQILIHVCEAIEYLHSIGGFIGDLNGGNILIKDKVVYIIDSDGMSLDDVKNFVYTNMYIYPPSAENKNITAEDDWYSLAVQAFYYLTYSHPFRGVCKNPKIPLNEIDRMKEGLSVLGNHGINRPSISIGWEFMPKYMISFFLETFEGSKRENMMNVLKRFVENDQKERLSFKEIQRSRDVLVALSEDSYVDSNRNMSYKEKEQFKLTSDVAVDVKIIGDKLFFFGRKICMFNEKTGKTHMFERCYDREQLLDADGEKIYRTSEDRTELFVDTLNSTGKPFDDVITKTIRRATNNPIISLIVTNGDKFVIVEDNISQETFDIYCNMINIAKIPKTTFSGETRVDMLYDEFSEKWLVLFIDKYKTFGFVIDKRNDKKHSTFELNEVLPGDKSFWGNVLYYPADKEICYYNITTGIKKSIDCKVVSPTSRIDRHQNKFIIHNYDKTYMYLKS